MGLMLHDSVTVVYLFCEYAPLALDTTKSYALGL